VESEESMHLPPRDHLLNHRAAEDADEGSGRVATKEGEGGDDKLPMNSRGN